MRGTTNIPCVYTLIRQDGKYSLPAGHVEGSESFREAAAREAKEEINVDVTADDLKHVFTMHRHCGDHIRVDVFFEAIKWSGMPKNNEPEFHSRLEWFSDSELPLEGIMNYQAYALQRFAREERYGEFGWPEQKKIAK